MIKFILFIFIYILFIIIQKILHFPILNLFSRTFEVLVNIIISTILLSLLGVYSPEYKFKKQDPKRYKNINKIYNKI